jgi:ribA/ribD-fused uncharacterized protein
MAFDVRALVNINLRYNDAGAGYPLVRAVSTGGILKVVNSEHKDRSEPTYKVVALPDSSPVSLKDGPEQLNIYVRRASVERLDGAAAASGAPSATPLLSTWPGAIPDKINFYESGKPFYEFTNFWICENLNMDHIHSLRGGRGGGDWHTTEHYYQAMKFIDALGNPTDPGVDHVENIRALPTAREAFDYSNTGPGAGKDRGTEWHSHNKNTGVSPKDQAMHNVVAAKFTQNRRLHELLMSTAFDRKSRTIVETAGTKDLYWGSGDDPGHQWTFGTHGGNKLGQLLYNIRRDFHLKRLLFGPRMDHTEVSYPFPYLPGAPPLSGYSPSDGWYADKLKPTFSGAAHTGAPLAAAKASHSTGAAAGTGAYGTGAAGTGAAGTGAYGTGAARPPSAAAPSKIKIKLKTDSKLKKYNGPDAMPEQIGNPKSGKEYWADGADFYNLPFLEHDNGSFDLATHYKVFNDDGSVAGYINSRNVEVLPIASGGSHHKNKKSLKSKKILHSKKKKKLKKKKKKTKRKINLSDISQYRFSMSSSNGPLRKRSKRKKRSKKKKRSKRK